MNKMDAEWLVTAL